MVGTCFQVVAIEERGEGFGSVLERGVDNRGLRGLLLESLEKVGAMFAISEGSDGEIEVGAVEGELVVVVRLDLEIAADVLGNLWSGGGGEAKDTRDFEFGGKLGELEVVGPEVVAPLGDTMSFVDGKEGEL